MPRLTVIIVNYNVKHYLHQCLTAVERAIHNLDAQIIVVDNASTDQSIPFLQPLHPQVQFIANTKNLGFAKANNQAIKASETPTSPAEASPLPHRGADAGEASTYLLLLNPDTIIPEDTLTQAITFLDQHPAIGATGVRMYNPDGTFAPESRRAIPTPWVAFCKIIGLTKLFPQSKRFGKYYLQYLAPNQPTPIEIISGAFCLIRRTAIQQCGTLDEDYFMYGEDIDLSYRLLKAGWQNYYLPLPILHYKGESTRIGSFTYVNNFHKAMLIFLRKHFSSYGLAFSLPIKAAILLKAIITYISYKIRAILHHTPNHQNPLDDIRQLTFAVANPQDRDAAAHILQPYGINILPTQQNKQADVIIANPEQHSYKEILQQHTQRATQQQIQQLATIYPTQHIIITPFYIFH